MSRVAVVGGGLAGLVAARRLAGDGKDVTLFERQESVGGRVRSIREDGYIYDRGFQVLFTGYPAARRELDYNALDLRYFTGGATIARPGKRSVLTDPRANLGDITETLFNTEVRFSDKLRLFALKRELARVDVDTNAAAIFDQRTTRSHSESQSQSQSQPQSIESYLADKGFSKQFVDNFAAPFYGGITLDRSLSTDAGVFRYTFKMLAEGKSGVPANGMGAISAQLADRARSAGVDIELDTAVETVQTTHSDGGAVTVEAENETVTVDGVVVATDPQTAAELTDIDGIPTETRGCVTQYYVLPRRVTLDTGKKILLNAHNADPNQIVPLSTVAPEYAPDHETLLSATWLGQQTVSDAQLADRARETLESWYPARRFDGLALKHTSRIDGAQFKQPPGFRTNLPDVDDPEGPVVLAGDYTQWSSIQGALESGRIAAETLGQQL